jgi:Domain of Unknown Function with PDB structure (DUF3857)/Transglutaminase-like superfamily/Domain of Unknown Function with PDB structure (DUF3858)
MQKHLLLFLCAFTFLMANAQRPKIKYGEVGIQDLQQTIYNIDSGAQAVVLYNYCRVKYEGDNRGDFNVSYKYHKRIKLLSKNAFDLATVQITLSKFSEMEEKIETLNATTYTLEGDKVVTTKIDKASIFKDKIDKNYQQYKFTLPNLKEGCIIEYTYTVLSPYSQHLKNWYFQESYPVLWSEYDITVPAIFDFVTYKRGYLPYAIDTAVVSQDNYTILFPGTTAGDRSEVSNVNLNTYHSTWAIQNLPALKREIFISTLRNYVARIEFQLSALRYPNSPMIPKMRTWIQAGTDLLTAEYFGKDLDSKNHWLDGEVNAAMAGAKNEEEKARKIYGYLQKNFTCTDYSNLGINEPLKKSFQAKRGTVSDINLLLVAAYKSIGLDAKPVILSTKDNGWVYDAYPILSQYNYVLCQLKINQQTWLLDAAEPRLGFGKLDDDCYNGTARVVDKMPYIINLSADSLKETKLTNVFIINDEKGMVTGSFNSNLGYYESYALREKLAKQKEEDFFKDIKKGYSFEVEVNNTHIDSLKLYDEPMTVGYDFKFATNEDIIYFNPLLTEAQKENPFKSAKRFYPVEMPYTMDETYILTMEIPKGYIVEEMPKSTRVKLNDDDGMFEYIIAKSGTTIQLRNRLQIKRAIFESDDYQTLRDFFAFIVKKQSELIVFKKEK